MAITAALRLLAGSLILWEQRGNAHSASQIALRYGRDLIRLFQELFVHVQCTYPFEAHTLSRTDVDAALEWLLQKKPKLTDWYQLLLPSSEIVLIEWRNRQPSIDPNAIVQWERLTNEFDPDALLAFDLATRYSADDLVDQVQKLQKWRTVPRVVDHELSECWSRGLSDLHVHASGVRVPQAAWQEIMAGERNADVFKGLQYIYKHEKRDFKQDMIDACKHRSLLIQIVLKETDVPRRQATTRRWWRWSSALLLQERRMLVEAWRRALDHRADPQQVITHLDNYLQHKHRYCRLARQPVFNTYTGLRHFDTRYFGALKRSSRGPRHPIPIAYASSTRHQMTPIGDACAYLLESEHLQRIELRMAPFDTVHEYLRFFKDWYGLQQQINHALKVCQRKPVTIRFAVHFKRTARPTLTFSPTHLGQVPDARRQLMELDRQSAALRVALGSLDERHRRWMAGLVRIDVAGQERDTPASLFALHMRLLRGDPQAMEYIDDSNAGHPCRRWFQRWLHLRSRGEHRPSLTEEWLGITVHAGEDFADVLDGLYQVSSAIDGCALRAGDGIGHGLVLKIEPHAAKLPRYAMISRGVHHDSLCWLYDRIDNQDTRNDFHWAFLLLRIMIEESGNEIYQIREEHGIYVTCDDFLWVWRHKTQPLERERQRASVLRKDLACLAYQDDVLLRREHMIPLDQKRQQLETAIRWAQQSLLDEIKKKRIVIEMNPASNLRISGAESLEKSPTVALATEVANGLLACVNTDNPGVFSSCIENEYALLLGGLIHSGVTQGEARNLLERIRDIGMHTVY